MLSGREQVLVKEEVQVDKESVSLSIRIRMLEISDS